MEINRNNYEEFFLLYVDNELPATGRKAVEDFVLLHPDLKEELELLTETVLVPSESIVYENKEELYKKEERRVVPFAWWRMAAAAVLIFGLGTFGWLYLGSDKPVKRSEAMAGVTKNTEETETEKPVIANTQEEKKTESVPAGPAKTQATVKEVAVDKPAVKKAEVPAKKRIEPAPVTENVAAVEMHPVDEPIIDVAVAPRKLDKEINEVPVQTAVAAAETQPHAQYASQPEYVQTSDDNIYFANTTVSKRNKFRGVFRKATRFLDKVTSIQ